MRDKRAVCNMYAYNRNMFAPEKFKIRKQNDANDVNFQYRRSSFAFCAWFVSPVQMWRYLCVTVCGNGLIAYRISTGIEFVKMGTILNLYVDFIQNSVAAAQWKILRTILLSTALAFKSDCNP